MTTTTQTFLDGTAPVTEEVTTTDLPVTGRLPAELSGRLLRIGPNPRPCPTRPRTYWFTGDGMVHGVRLRDGRAEWYRNRWVRGDEAIANTHVIGVDGRTFALVEAGNCPSSSPTSSATIELLDDTLDGLPSAHTHPPRDRRPPRRDLPLVVGPHPPRRSRT